MKTIKAALVPHEWSAQEESNNVAVSHFLHSRPGILRLLRDFCHYVAVGGGAFLVDYAVFNGALVLQLHYMVATAFGFLAGLLTNYFLCVFWVWRGTAARTLKDLLVFSIIGVGGLLLTALLMWMSVSLLNFDARISKLFIAAIVLVWNFALRRVFVFFH